MAVKFGTSGLRGLSVELTGAVSARYAAAFVRFLLLRKLCRSGDFIMVGRDFRESSPAIASICMAAIRRAGLVPIDCGAVPTPALAQYAMASTSACLMVTGSHIPADRNGIKFYRPDGEITKDDEVAIVSIADDLATEMHEDWEAGGGGEDRFARVCGFYAQRNEHILAPDALKGLKVGVYQHSTVSRDLLVDILRFYGAEVTPLGRSQEFVAVDTEAVSAETCLQLREWAVGHRLNAIVSADGDGDRPLVADENGLPLRGDLLGLIAARFLGADMIATPVTSNSGIDQLRDVDIVRTRVGSPYVLAAMATAGAAGHSGIVGFEANGGVMLGSSFMCNDHLLAALPTRDGVLPILTALQTLSSQPLSGVSSLYAFPVAMSDRLEDFSVERSSALLAFLRASPENRQRFVASFGPNYGSVAAVSDVDGLRMTLSDGSVVHFRASGNAPEMRCYVEAVTQAKAEHLLASGLRTIEKFEAPDGGEKTNARSQLEHVF